MSGFNSFKFKSQPKPSDKYKSQPPVYTSTSAIAASAAKVGYGSNFSKKHATEEDYFESGDIEESDSRKKEYQPASDSSEEEEDDPLDSFMASIEVHLLNT